MFEPTATTQTPQSKQQLHDAFMQMAQRSFELSQKSLRWVDFYKAVLRKLDRGESIEDEVPEVQGVMPEVVRLTVQRLLKSHQIGANQAWELADSYKSCFVTTVRSALPEPELIPQYDVEYVGQIQAGEAKISVKSFRRSIQVQVQGSEEALDQLWIQMSFAALTSS